MRIGVDCHILSGKFQGSRTYFLNLYKTVLELDSRNEYFFFGHWNDDTPFGQKASYVDFPPTSRWQRLTYQTYNTIRKYNLDLYHTNYISPLILPCKSLLTVHDILFETHPQYFNKIEVLRNKLFVKLSAKNAALIHTVSEYTEKMLESTYSVPGDKITVVPNGVDINRFNPENKNTSSDLIETKYGIKQYMLTVGRLEPRKNHVNLLLAFAKLSKKMPDVGPLVIVGQKDFGYQRLYVVINELGLSDKVIFLENVADDVLPHIYKAARLFVYPSFAEGFGIPPLEAMACGIPVITSNTTSIPEIVSEAGTLVDPYDTNMLAEAMHTVLNEPNRSEKAAMAGTTQAAKWTWQNSARKYMESLEESKD